MGMVCDKKNKSKENNISHQPHFKDAVATCGSTTTTLASGSGVTSPIPIATLQADTSCVKCPVTLVTFSGILTGTASTAETITISLKKSFYNTCNCCCNYGMTPTAATVKQFTITPATTTAQTIPFTFQFCDTPGQNCGCCDSDCATYTITAVSSATTSAFTISGLSFTALTVANGCCGCICGCNNGYNCGCNCGSTCGSTCGCNCGSTCGY